MGFTGIEPILDTLKTELSSATTGVPAKIMAITFSPVITMANPKEYAIGDRDLFEEYPAIALMSLRSPVDLDRNPDRMNMAHRVGIRVFVTHPDKPEDLERLLLRYTRVVVEVLADRRNAGAFTFTLDFAGQEWTYSEQRRNQKDEFERDVLIPITCWTAENRT